MILLYHSIVPDDSPLERVCTGQALPQAVFEEQISWLTKQRCIVSLSEYIVGLQDPNFPKENRIALTFDDGFRSTFECVYAFLVGRNIPFTIFATTSHLENGDMLWFSYLRALCLEEAYDLVKVNQQVFPLQTIRQRKRALESLQFIARTSGDPISFCEKLTEDYPLPLEILALYKGMSCDQIRIAAESSFIDIGAHTLTHPYLDQLSRENQEKQIREGKSVLSDLTGTKIRYFAYPAGEYTYETVQLVKNAGYQAAFAIIPKQLNSNSLFEISRVGIYSHSLFKLKLKIFGMADLLRRVGLRVG